MDRSIAQGPRPDAGGAALASAATGGRTTLVVGLGFVLACLALYQLTRPAYQTIYDHFAWQALAWLEGHASIRFPVADSPAGPGNDYFQDVIPVLDAAGTPTGRGMIPFPPLPAVVLLPFVALAGLSVDQALLSVVIGAIDVGLAFWLLGRLAVRPAVRNLLTVFVGGGAALWYAASLGSTWYFAHVIAVGLTLAAVALALDPDGGRVAPRRSSGPLLDRRGLAAGLLLGLAATSRLTVVLGLPFLVLAGGADWRRRAVAVGLGAAIPVGGLLLYTWVATGSLFNPVYEALYRYEVVAYPELGYQPSWGLEDLRYIPRNLEVMLLTVPDVLPPCDPGVPREVFSAAGCGLVVPKPVGTSLFLASPGLLLVLPALRRLRDRRVLASLAASGAIALANLAHFSQGWVQFGYRFSLDFLPFLLVAIALGTERFVGPREAAGRGRLLVAAGLVAASVGAQAWGIAWARTLGW